MSTAQPAGSPGSGARPAGDREPADGRAARSHRSRRAIVNAMRELHAEGDHRPTAPRVAERAGVSLRTVWQQFADMETLLVAAALLATPRRLQLTAGLHAITIWSFWESARTELGLGPGPAEDLIRATFTTLVSIHGVE